MKRRAFLGVLGSQSRRSVVTAEMIRRRIAESSGMFAGFFLH
jgi:hypothetical protein